MFGTGYMAKLLMEYRRKVSRENKDMDHLLYILSDENSEHSVNGIQTDPTHVAQESRIIT